MTSFQAQQGSALLSASVTVTLTCPTCLDPNVCYGTTVQNITKNIQLVDVGSFALNSNFTVLGNPDTNSMTEIHDPPPSAMVVSAIIDSRSFTPFYVLLPARVTTTPNFTQFETYGERNSQYNAQFGKVNPQLYLECFIYCINWILIGRMRERERVVSCCYE